jgi:hypothetical protein
MLDGSGPRTCLTVDLGVVRPCGVVAPFDWSLSSIEWGSFPKVDRDHLARILDCEGEAFAACRGAVLDGARFWVTDSTQPASELARTYARRERGTRERGIPTLGFAEAVTALRERGEGPVRLGAVDTDDPPYHFQLFIDGGGTAVVACLGVDQAWKTQRH